MRALLILAAGAFALAGCRVVESQDNAAEANAAVEVALDNAMPAEETPTEPLAANAIEPASTELRPGQWETTVAMIEAEMPGMPKMAGDQIKAQGKAKTHSYCMTPEDAKRPKGGWLTGNADNRCTYSKFSMAGGRIDSVLSCPGPDGREAMTVATSGSFTAEQLDAEANMAMGGAQGMKIKARVTSRRTGDCTTAPEAGAGAGQ